MLPGPNWCPACASADRIITPVAPPLARGEHRMAAIGACEHARLTGPAAAGAARRPGTSGERARFQGSAVLDATPATAAHGQARPGRLSRRVHHLRPRPHQGAG